MAGNDAIAAALAAAGPMVMQGFGKPKSRYDRQAEYAAGLLKTGSSTAPVSGWVEGIARALQGPLGGYFANETQDAQQADEATRRDELTSAFATNDFNNVARALASIPGQEGAAATLLLGRLSQQNQQTQLNDRTKVLAGAPGTGAPGTGTPGVPAGAGAPPGAGVVGGAGLDSDRYNVGNIRAPQGGFQTFDSPEAAVAATIANARAYPAAFNGGRLMPLWDFSIDMAKLKAKDPAELAKAGRTIAGRWAPVGDGANDPAQWARNAANAAGLPPDQSIDLSNPEIAARFARGVHAAEFGGQAAYADLVYTRGAAGQPQPAPAPGVGVPSNSGRPVSPADRAQNGWPPVSGTGQPQPAPAPGVGAPPAAVTPPQAAPRPDVGAYGAGGGAPNNEPRPTAPALPQRPDADAAAGYMERYKYFVSLGHSYDKAHTLAEYFYKKHADEQAAAINARNKQTIAPPDRVLDTANVTVNPPGVLQAIEDENAAKARGAAEWVRMQNMPGYLINTRTGDIKAMPAPSPMQQGPDGVVVTPGYPEAAAIIAAAQKAPDPDAARHSFTQLPSYKNYTSAAPIYQSMQEAATRNSKAADLNMVYALAKILDPTSVVRESEVVMSRDTGGIADRLNGFISGLRGGATLTPDVRAGMLAEARSRMSGYYNAIQLDAEQYANIAQRRGWNVADTIPAFALLPEPQTDRISQTPRPTAGGPQAAPPANAPAPADPLSQAREAIARGVPLDAVVQRLRENGIDPGGL